MNLSPKDKCYLIATAIILLFSCSKKNDALPGSNALKIIGIWKPVADTISGTTSSTTTILFANDGSGLSTLQFNADGSGIIHNSPFTYSVEGDILTLNNANYATYFDNPVKIPAIQTATIKYLSVSKLVLLYSFSNPLVDEQGSEVQYFNK